MPITSPAAAPAAAASRACRPKKSSASSILIFRLIRSLASNARPTGCRPAKASSNGARCSACWRKKATPAICPTKRPTPSNGRARPLTLRAKASSSLRNYCGTPSRVTSAHDPEKWETVFGQDHAQTKLRSIMAEELPIFLGLNDKTITDIPKTVEKQRYMTSVAPKAANPGKWVEQPRMPIPTGEHAVIECQGKIHSIAGYAKHRVDQNFHQVYDPASKTWSLKAPFPHPCNHVAGVSIGSKIYTFGGFVEQNRCPHSKCFVYDTTIDPHWS